MTRPHTAPRSREANLMLHAAAAGDARALARLLIRQHLGVAPENAAAAPAPLVSRRSSHSMLRRSSSTAISGTALPESAVAVPATWAAMPAAGGRAAAAAASAASPPRPLQVAALRAGAGAGSGTSRLLGRRGSLAAVVAAGAGARAGASGAVLPRTLAAPTASSSAATTTTPPLGVLPRRFSAADVAATAQLPPTELLKVHASDGSTPLLVAAKRGHREVVELLLALGATLNDRDCDPKRQGNVLHYACWGGHVELVRWLLDARGADAGATDVVGNTPLLYAVYGGHRNVVEELLRRGRSLRERNHKNHSAILQAACGGHMELVEWLLEQGFSLAEADNDGNTALLFAAWGGHQRLMEYLVTRGASLHEVNHNGHSVFLSAANGGRVEIVEWLLQRGFSLHETNNNGDTALLLAAYGGHRQLVERLLELGASLSDTNACGFTPLLSAANGGQLEMAAWLLQRGANLAEADHDGYTSLILAACGGNTDLVSFFLSRGASLSERNSNGDSALLLAAYCGHTALVHWLLDHGASLAERNNTGMGVLISAANGGHLETVRAVHERLNGAGLEDTDEGGYTPLLLAAQRGHLETVKYLACYGANLHARTTRHSNDAITLAGEAVDVQEYLRFVWHFDALRICADARATDRVHEMLVAGADPVDSTSSSSTSSRKSSNGTVPSPLQLACSVGQYSTAKPVDPELAALLQMAVKPWSPRRHVLYGASFRRAVVFMVWLKKELDNSPHLPYLPPEIWLHVVACMRRDWFAERSSSAHCPLQPHEAPIRRRSRQMLLAPMMTSSSSSSLAVSGMPMAAGSTSTAEPSRRASSVGLLGDGAVAVAAQEGSLSPPLSEPLLALLDAVDGGRVTGSGATGNGDGDQMDADEAAEHELFALGMDELPEQLVLADGTPGHVTPQAALDPEDAMDLDADLPDPYAKGTLTRTIEGSRAFEEDGLLVRITWV